MKLSLILFPLFLGAKEFKKIDYHLVFEYLIYGCLVLMLINYGTATVSYFETGRIEEYFYSDLSPNFHVAYASVYCILGLSMVYYLYVKSYKYFANIWISSFLVLLFSVHVVLLNSKASFIAMMLVFLIIFIYFLKTKYFKSFILPALVVLSISIAVLFSFDFLYVRFFGGLEVFKAKEEQTISNDFKKEKDKEIQGEAPVASSQVRVIAWSAAMEIIKQKPFGVGIGDRKDVFVEKVANKGHARFKEKGLNTHNQYLQVLLAIGIPGLMIFLINLFYPIIEAFKRKNFLWFAFVANISVNIFFESMLEVQAGIIFYAFFSILLAKQMMEDRTTSQEL